MRTDLRVLAGLILLALLSMIVYRARYPAGRDDPAASKGGSFFLGLWVRNWFYWFVGPAERASLRLGLRPDFFNFLGLGFGIASMILFWRGALVAAGWAILLGGIADILDGRIARSRNLASRYGAFIDSTLDRFSEFASFTGLAAFYGGGAPVLLILVALGSSQLVSYTRARGESLDILCKLGIMQRAERMLALGFGALLDEAVSARFGREPGALLVVIIAVIAAGSLGTAVFRTVWISRRLAE